METETVKLEKNQETHAPNGWGGRRENSGRKRHSRDKLVVSDFFSPEEKEQLVATAKELTINAEGKPDKEMVKFLWEQIFGKAKMTTVQEDSEGNDVMPVLVKILRDGSHSD